MQGIGAGGPTSCIFQRASSQLARAHFASPRTTKTFSWEMHSYILVGTCFINLNAATARTSSRTSRDRSFELAPEETSHGTVGRFGTALLPEHNSPPDERVCALTQAGLAARMRLVARPRVLSQGRSQAPATWAALGSRPGAQTSRMSGALRRRGFSSLLPSSPSYRPAPARASLSPCSLLLLFAL